MASVVRVGLCQVLVTAEKATNFKTVEAAVRDVVEKGCELVMLPEVWNSPYATDCFPKYAEVFEDGESVALVKRLAQEHKVWLVGGSIPERDGDKVYNTSFVADPSGAIVARHRKVHLFDIDVPGGITFKESDTLTAGKDLTMFDTPWGRIGLGICYDMRFAEYAQALAAQGCIMTVYPGAFNTVTGPAHWELLQRARAVDNQMFVLTCSPARNPDSTYQAWGHSSAIDPWGKVVATTEHNPANVVVDLDLKRVEEVRTSVPIRTQKRFDVYGTETDTSPWWKRPRALQVLTAVVGSGLAVLWALRPK